MSESREQLLRSMIGRKVSKVYVHVWPPYMEEKLLEVSMSVGVGFEDEPSVLYTISIDIDDGWSPMVEKALQPDTIGGDSLQSRVSRWMSGELVDILGLETFDMGEDPGFRSIRGESIQSVGLITLAEKFDPFGVILRFDKNFLQITPTSDGSTVETLAFNNHSNVEVFKQLGDLQEVDLSSMRNSRE